MQFIQSLLCIKGSDNRIRFLTINVVIYFAFTIFSAITAPSIIMGFSLLAISSFFSAVSIIRRLNDARLKNNWMPIATGLFLICGTIIILSQVGAAYWLLLLPLSCLAILLTYPSQNNLIYTLGYFGPVDLSQYEASTTHHNQRIEPSVNGDGISIKHNPMASAPSHQARNVQQVNGPDIGEQIRTLLFSHKNAVITLVSIIAIVVTGFIVSSFLNNKATPPSPVENTTLQQAAPTSDIEKLFPIEFADGFTLMISQHSGLILSWQADQTGQNELWQQISAKGDSSCKVIEFNDQKKIRTISVLVENGSSYYAHFSPLDTETLLKNLAYRGSFNLCGYDFSLKGSQAQLVNNSPYNNLTDY